MAERKIGDRTFKTEPMLAMNALVLQAHLLRVVGSGIDRLPEIFAGRTEKATPEERSKSDAAAIAAFSDIFKGSDPQEIAGLIKAVVEESQILRPSGAYEPADIDGDFTGRLGDIIPVAVFVLKEQFGSFFSGALANGSRALKAKG